VGNACWKICVLAYFEAHRQAHLLGKTIPRIKGGRYRVPWSLGRGGKPQSTPQERIIEMYRRKSARCRRMRTTLLKKRQEKAQAEGNSENGGDDHKYCPVYSQFQSRTGLARSSGNQSRSTAQEVRRVARVHQDRGRVQRKRNGVGHRSRRRPICS
jgi:hypothetical protein